MSPSPLRLIPADLGFSPDEEAALALVEAGLGEDSENSITAQDKRRAKECAALQAAWARQARCMELLTAAGVPPGDLVDRLHAVLKRLSVLEAAQKGAL